MAQSNSLDSVHFASRSNAFRFPQLRPATSAEEYALHLAALEWSLDSPITIRSEEEIQSTREWKGRLEPYAHQVRNLLTFCNRAPATLLADDVGLGKTISAGLILSELMVRKKVSRALVVAPKMLLSQWCEELAVKFNIPACAAVGADLLGALKRSIPVVVTTYHSIRNHLTDLRYANLSMIVLDEAHKLRNLHGTSKPPAFAVGIRKALADRVFKYVLMLTATPIQNRLWDLYSLIDLMTAAKGHANPLGEPELFKSRYIEDSRAVLIKRGRREEFRQHLSNYIVRTRRSDAKLVFPTRKVRTFKVAASRTEKELLKLVKELFTNHSLNGLAQSSIGQALMSSPEALVSQLTEMANRGTVPQAMAAQAAKLLGNQEVTGKFSGLLDLLKELSVRRPLDWRVIIFTSRTQTLEAIGKQLLQLNMKVGFISGSRSRDNEKTIHGFRASPPQYNILVSTDTGAEGLNLQAANVMVNYDLPWNPMLLEQRIGRIQRLASEHAEVTVLNLVLAGSVEEHVVGRLGEKLQVIAESIGDIEGILESASGAAADDDSFEAMIRKLVTDSLKGIDVKEATRQAVKSIEEAKQIFDEEKETVEKTLGDLKDLHRSGPRVPEIAPVVPSIEAKDFVLRALKQDGGRVEAIGDDLYSVTMPGHNEYRITFKDRGYQEFSENESYFGSNAPRVYLPGKRDFERLAQSWADKAGALIADRTRTPHDVLETHLQLWMKKHQGFQLSDLEVTARQSGFRGKLTCRGSVAVNHDRLEKLVDIDILPQHAYEILPEHPEERLSASSCDTGQLGSQLHDLVVQCMKKEANLNKFCKFYDDRLREELPAADTQEQQRRLRDQFTPVAAADAVAARGVQYALFRIKAQLRIDGQGPYTAEFLLVPGHAAVCEIQAVSDWEQCQYSQRSAPVSALAACAHSGLRVLKHLMQPSALSGKLALTEHLKRCEETGELLLPGETLRCTVTGKVVRLDRLQASALSGKLALPEMLQTCHFTGDPVLPDELAVSAISGRKYRIDQAQASGASGRQGHSSEFVAAVLPEGWLAEDEAIKSDLSGKAGLAERMVRSQLVPHRYGLPCELVESAVSGLSFLQDEVVRSEVGGGLALPSEMATCEMTAARVLPSELMISEISGKKFRIDQKAQSVFSGRTGHQTEFVRSEDPSGFLANDEAGQSEISGRWALREKLTCSDVPPHRRVLRDELLVSAVSGKRALPVEMSRSTMSGKPALPEELVVCQFTGAAVLPEELAISRLSGKAFRKDEVRESVESHRLGHQSEFVQSVLPAGWIAVDESARSEFSGKVAARTHLLASDAAPGRLGLPEEFIRSAVSGRRYLADEIACSALSAEPAHPSELVACEFTGIQVMPGELVTSSISGKKFRVDQVMTSTLSSRQGHRSEFVHSTSPTGWLAQDEAGQSDVSKLWGATKKLVTSEREPYRRGLPNETVKCEWTGRRLLSDEVSPSAVSGKSVDTTLLIRSAASQLLAVPEEMCVCELTHVKLLPKECGKCAITGKLVDKRQLLPSKVSGLSGIKSLMVQCCQSEILALPNELEKCEVSGKQALARFMVTCSLTGRKGLRRYFQQCPTTSLWHINDSLSRDKVKELTGSDVIMRRCQWTGKDVIATRLLACSLSGLIVHDQLLNVVGELELFRHLLDGKRIADAVVLHEGELSQLRTLSPKLRLAREAIAIESPSHGYIVAVVRTKAGILGFGAYYYAVTIQCAQPMILVGDPVPGRRTNDLWVRQD